MAKRQIQSGTSIPERLERHSPRNWVNLSFNHKTTLTMGALVPMACKEVYPGELAKLYMELKMRFAALYLPIMHQCYFSLDWYYVRMGDLWQGTFTNSFETFMKQDPVTGNVGWTYFNYKRSHAIFTDGILNYMGFNAPPPAGTLIFQTQVSAMPVAAYAKIWNEYYRNTNIQNSMFTPLEPGDMTSQIEAMLPQLRVKRRNWPRDYYTSATPTPQQGENVLIPSYATDPETGQFVPQQLIKLDGTSPSTGNLRVGTADTLQDALSADTVLQLSSTIRDFRYAAQFTEFLERSMRAGGLQGRWSDFVKRNFDWDPNPLMIDRPVWIGGYTGDIIIQEVMATAEAGEFTVGEYAGQAIARDNTPVFTYQVPDYGFVIPILTVYPKASYYSGLETMWTRRSKMDYMFEQFALIGDQPIRNKEVWFSWYDADIAWNDEIFGYLPQYTQHRYSNDIVSGQMRTLWESFHLGRKFIAAAGVNLNSEFITCTPDIGRVFVVDAEGGEHETLVHAYVGIEVLRRLPFQGLPML